MFQIDNVFIKAAGMGTRMGPLGRDLPKVLWPIADKTLLELQIEYARQFRPKTIVINAHHKAHELSEYIESTNSYKSFIEQGGEIFILKELPEILGSGGCIHNLKSIGRFQGKWLCLNADQFLLFDLNELSMLPIDEVCSILINIKITPNDGYNALNIDHENQLQGIIKNGEQTQSENYVTFSGVSILNLDQISYVKGASSFFATVADYKNKKVLNYSPEKYEYWDFGTLELYKKNIVLATKEKNHDLATFLKSVLNSYGHIKFDDEPGSISIKSPLTGQSHLV